MSLWNSGSVVAKSIYTTSGVIGGRENKNGNGLWK